MSAKDKQIGGDHYKDMAIQPWEFCQANHLSFAESNVIKYVCRHRSKAGKQDIEKAIHNLQMLIELEYSGPAQDYKQWNGWPANGLMQCTSCYHLKQGCWCHHPDRKFKTRVPLVSGRLVSAACPIS